MTNPKCAVCGHVNRVGAVACVMCGGRLGAPAGDAQASGAAGVYGARPGGSDPGGFDSGDGDVRAGALPTDIPSPQFQGAGDVISPTLELYRKHFPLVGLLVLVTTLPLALLQYTFYNVVLTTAGTVETGGGGGGMAAVGASAGGTAFYWLLTTLGNALLSGALAYAVVQIQRTGAAGAGASLLWGLAKVLKVFAVLLITYLLIYGLPALVLLFAALTLGEGALCLVVLMLVPWIVLTLMFSLAVPAAAIENRGVFEAMSRSVRLTKGYRGLIFMTYFLWWLVIIALNVVVTWSFYYGGGAGGSLVAFLVQMAASGVFSSSMIVLTIYIFLGILNEGRQGFGTRHFTSA